MTVAEAGTHDGLLQEVQRESGLDTDAPVIEFTTIRGRINVDLTVGVDVTVTKPLLANEGVCSRWCEVAWQRLHRDAGTSGGARVGETARTGKPHPHRIATGVI